MTENGHEAGGPPRNRGFFAARARPRETGTRPADALPRGVVVAGAWSWRLLAIGAVIAVLVFLIIQLSLLVIPVCIAALLGALLIPAVDALHRHRWPRWLAITLVMLALIVAVVGLITLVVWQVRAGYDDLRAQSVQAYESFRQWLETGPLGLTDHQLDQLFTQLQHALQQDSQIFLSGAISVGSSIGHFATGFLLCLFATLFILIDGKSIWKWIVRVFPRRSREALDGAGRVGWTTLVNFARVQVFVAFIDAVGIGIGAVVLHVPLAIPIAVLVFLGSFIPIIGAIATGILAVFIALVFNGWVVALIMLAVVLFVHQFESHVLQPLIMGSAVKVHPLAVVLAVAGGTMLAGIPGALFAVPAVAVLNVMITTIASGTWRPGSAPGGGPGIWRTVERGPSRRSEHPHGPGPRRS